VPDMPIGHSRWRALVGDRGGRTDSELGPSDPTERDGRGQLPVMRIGGRLFERLSVLATTVGAQRLNAESAPLMTEHQARRHYHSLNIRRANSSWRRSSPREFQWLCASGEP
jgi:hypothetical protein